jgi:outer membrane immunogenic protein
MKKTLAAVTIAALVGVAGAASAADLYKGGSLKDAPVFVPPPTWTGFYLGGHVGGAWGELKNNYAYDPAYYYTPDAWKITNDGVFGGGTLGYNFQTGSFVFGFEADFGAIGFSNTNKWAGGDRYGVYGANWYKQDSSFYADVTGRLGYAAGPALFYAKGGWAYLDNSATFGFGNLSNSWKNDSLDGWTVGGGIEYMWSPSWSVKAEYQYFDFGKKSFDVYDATYFPYHDRWDDQLTLSTFKVGLNYHFGNAYAPLK